MKRTVIKMLKLRYIGVLRGLDPFSDFAAGRELWWSELLKTFVCEVETGLENGVAIWAKSRSGRGCYTTIGRIYKDSDEFYIDRSMFNAIMAARPRGTKHKRRAQGDILRICPP